jgi:hypothetical protein
MRNLSTCLFLILVAAISVQALAEDKMTASVPKKQVALKSTVTPINAAESILDVFWDPLTSDLKEWRVEPGAAHGLQVTQGWIEATIEWVRKPAAGPVLRMSRSFDLDCHRYDKLIVSGMLPDKGTLRVIVETDKGQRQQELPRLPGMLREYLLDLQGATRLKGITLEIQTADPGIGAACLDWIGLQNSALLPEVLQQYRQFDPQWPGLLKPETYEPEFKPTYGFILDSKQLADLQALHLRMQKRDGETVFMKAAKYAQKTLPENMIDRFANLAGHRSCRDRNQQNVLVQTGVSAAMAGLVMKDKDLLRLGARYALSLAACEYWDDGFMCYFPGSAWEERCFIQALDAHDIAMLLDLAGEMFTEAGKQVLLRKLAEHGLGNMNFNYWKWEYIYHCNQAAWFSPGRMLGYSVVEKTWPRAKPYMELAYKDLLENLDLTILPDGGYPEGPSYFRCVGRDAGLALYYYAEARGKKLEDVIPVQMKRTDDFCQVLGSTVPGWDFLPIADSGVGSFEPLAKTMMALANPRGAWAALLAKTLKESAAPEEWPLQQEYSPNYMTSLSDVVLTWKLAREIKPEGTEPKPFVCLKDTGHIASRRRLGQQWVKLFIMGNKSGAGHCHEDKGSFILEAGGEPLAMDFGAGSYSFPDGADYCQFHNMLIPVGMPERPAPPNPLPFDIKPQGRGDQQSFHATVNLTPGWEKYYRKWVRTWDSPTPDVLNIRDEYELVRGAGVEFRWQTTQQITVEKNHVTISGKKVKLALEVPPEAEVRVEDVGAWNNAVHRFLSIRLNKTAGTLELKGRISLIP